MLSCSCSEWDGEGIGYYEPLDFTKLKTSKRKRCKSCGVLIDIGADCLEWGRMRYPSTEVELKIFSDDHEIFLASHYFCEDCGATCLSLIDVGFCIAPWDEMEALLAEYQDEYAHPAWQSFKDNNE